MSELKFDSNYSRWRQAFNTELVFTRRQMSEALQKKDRELELATQILSIVRALPNGDRHAMVIHNVHRTESGIHITVK